MPRLKVLGPKGEVIADKKGQLIVVLCAGRSFLGRTELPPEVLSDRIKKREMIGLGDVVELCSVTVPGQVKAESQVVSPGGSPGTIGYRNVIYHKSALNLIDFCPCPLKTLYLMAEGYYLVGHLPPPGRDLYLQLWGDLIRNGQATLRSISEAIGKAERNIH